MDLIQIEYFVEVADKLSFTRAAETLHISQPALSKQISLLEKELGVILIERKHRSIELTECGRIFLNEAKQLQAQVQKMIRKVHRAKNGTDGTINVGWLKTINDDRFVKILYRFKEKFPNYTVRVFKFEFDELRDRLDNGSVDIIFTLSFERSLISNASHRIIQEKSGCFVISKNHALAGKSDLAFDDLKQIPFIVIDRGVSAGAQMIQDSWKAQGYTPSEIIYVPNLETLLNYVRLGMGVSILDKSILKSLEEEIVSFKAPHSRSSFSDIAIWKKTNMNPVLTDYLNTIQGFLTEI
ncbi:MAG TPA: hypothetical protein DHN33_11640 [Eubacteriaceae bacterium]|nr:hypothetical protein [Eubacteriaceae bacterium]